MLAAGITINGLPIMLKRPYVGTMDIEELDTYYEDCVIGGPGSFVIPIREREKFIEATRTKLVLEVAGRSAGRTNGSGVLQRSSNFLYHRRENVARALGRRYRFSVGHSAHKLRDDFHVMGIAELVDRRRDNEPISAARAKY